MSSVERRARAFSSSARWCGRMDHPRDWNQRPNGSGSGASPLSSAGDRAVCRFRVIGSRRFCSAEQPLLSGSVVVRSMVEARVARREAPLPAARRLSTRLEKMERNQFFGGNPVGVLIRLALISIVVGVVMSALDIRPDNILYFLDRTLRRIWEMGFGSIEWLLEHLLLGAIVVIPIWIIARLIGVARRSGRES